MSPPPTIPGYSYLDHLGSGGFAEVYLYEQEWPRQRVAIKVVRPDVALSEREKGLFASEADAMARLADHPYIVSVITAGMTEDGRPYLVMRYCPPPDLGVRVRNAPMTVPDALATGIKLASAIETAHRSGILHRDIKPSNVLVTTYQQPALTDFGIAGHMHEVSGDADVRISYPWSPPEMLDGTSNGSVASDVYSLGATIWHLLVGRSPFSQPGGDNSTRGLSARILHAPAPATQRPDVPPALDRLLQQCLAKAPGHRPRTALELARSLQRIEAAEGLPRTPVSIEGDQVVIAGESAAHEEDATRLKPHTVVGAGQASGRGSAGGSASAGAVVGRPAGSRPPDRPDAPAEGAPAEAAPGGRRALLWTALGVLGILAVVVGVVAVGGDGGRRPGDPPPTPGASTPLSLAPEHPPVPPVVAADRVRGGVRFSWRGGDRGRDGDSWEWQRPDTGATERTDERSVLVRGRGRLCLDVRQIRDGQTSEFTRACG